MAFGFETATREGREKKTRKFWGVVVHEGVRS